MINDKSDLSIYKNVFCDLSIKKLRIKVSPKAGQTYPSPRTDKIVKALWKYWDDDLPIVSC